MKPARNHRLYCFDLDGTLVKSFIKDDGEPDPDHPYEKVVLREGAAAMVRVLARRGNEFAIITNQGGVAFGFQTEEEVGRRIGDTLRLLSYFWGRPFSVHACYTHPFAKVEKYKADDELRKPKPGMLLEAMETHDASTGETVFIGDMDSDAATAEAARVDYWHIEHFMRELGVGPRRPGAPALKSASSSPPPPSKTR